MGEIARYLFEANSEFQKLSVQLQTFLGSVEEGKEAFNVLNKFTLQTPFQLKEITERFIDLCRMGLNPLLKDLTTIGTCPLQPATASKTLRWA